MSKKVSIMKLIRACLWVISFPFYNIFYIALHNLQSIISCDILDTWCNRYWTYLLFILCGDNHYIWAIFPSSKKKEYELFCQQNLLSFNFWFYPLFSAFIEVSVFFPSSVFVEHLHLCLSSMVPSLDCVKVWKSEAISSVCHLEYLVQGSARGICEYSL